MAEWVSEWMTLGYVVLYSGVGLPWSCMVMLSPMWSFTAMYGLVWIIMVLYGLDLSNMIVDGHISFCSVLYGGV